MHQTKGGVRKTISEHGIYNIQCEDEKGEWHDLAGTYWKTYDKTLRDMYQWEKIAPYRKHRIVYKHTVVSQVWGPV